MIGVDLSVWHMVLSTERQLLDRKLVRKARIGAPPQRPSALSRLFRRDGPTASETVEAPSARLRQARGV